MNYFSLQTNITEYRIGENASRGIDKELGVFVVFTMEIPWSIVSKKFTKSAKQVVFIDSVDKGYLDQIISTLGEFDTVIGIGGGMAIDSAKYTSWKLNKRLVSIPTILSVDAFTTPAAGVRVNHDVEYIGSASPNPLIIDYSILRAAPKNLNIAGVGDLLSIHTASFDWTLAEKNGKSEYPYNQSAIDGGREILDFIYNNIGNIRENNNNGLRAIVEAYIALNTICLPEGHFRIEEGSEHYLFYELEERLKKPFLHGQIIGLGIYIMSRLQQNQPDFIEQIMKDVELEYLPRLMDIKKKDLEASLACLKAYVSSKDKLWYTIIDTVDITEDWIHQNIQHLEF